MLVFSMQSSTALPGIYYANGPLLFSIQSGAALLELAGTAVRYIGSLFSYVSTRSLDPPPLSPVSSIRRRMKLDAVYADFVHTAVTYGRTIISEYFLHEYMKSVRSAPPPQRPLG